jgi:hypothetical protein
MIAKNERRGLNGHCDAMFPFLPRRFALFRDG